MEESIEQKNPPLAQPQPVPILPQPKNNLWMILFIILITAIVVGGAVYLWQKSPQKPLPEEKAEVTVQPQISPTNMPSEPSPLPQSTLVSVGENWNKYTNPVLEFSLKVLKNMTEPYGQCPYSDKNGDHSYRPKEASVPVKIFEEGNSVFIAAEYFYKLTGETEQNNRSYFSGCDKTVNSTAIIKDWQNYHSPQWTIVIKSIASDGELDKFLKERYGEGCSLGEKKASKQDGVFDISIKGDGLDLGETKCPLNFMTVVKYYPAKQKVAAWNIGQACNFYYPTAATCYDMEMTDSFIFE